MFKLRFDQIFSSLVFAGLCLFFCRAWSLITAELGWSFPYCLASAFVALVSCLGALASGTMIFGVIFFHRPLLLVKKFPAGDTLFSSGEPDRYLEDDAFFWKWETWLQSLSSRWVSPTPEKTLKLVPDPHSSGGRFQSLGLPGEELSDWHRNN